MHKNDARIRRLQLIYYNTVTGSLWVLEASCLTAEAVLSIDHGNLCILSVSNAVRTRATSHPCERGAGLLEI